MEAPGVPGEAWIRNFPPDIDLQEFARFLADLFRTVEEDCHTVYYAIKTIRKVGNDLRIVLAEPLALVGLPNFPQRQEIEFKGRTMYIETQMQNALDPTWGVTSLSGINPLLFLLVDKVFTLFSPFKCPLSLLMR